ncbi:hypothetical protein ACHQM5_010966 [Ranunculus cassubicifolius]
MKLKLELRSPNNINGITLDPKPDWSFDDLVSELSSLELKQCVSSRAPMFTKTPPREFPNNKGSSRSSKAFVMRISDDDIVSDDEENQDPNLAVGQRYSCGDLDISDTDSSEDELALEESQVQLMEPVGLLEGLLSEREIEHQKWVEEEIRHTLDMVGMDLINESEKSTMALAQLEKVAEARRESDRKLDRQFRRKTAEALDNHLMAIQRNHAQKSQIEERKIRNDAVVEDAKRKEKAAQEEKLRQEKAKAQFEATQTAQRKAEQDQKEAQRRMAEEAEVKRVAEARQKAQADAAVLKEVKDRGKMIRAAEKALKLEEERLAKYKDLVEKNESLKSGSSMDVRQYEQQIARHIKQIAPTKENFRLKASELIKIIKNPMCPQSISVAMFVKKVVSRFETLSANFDSTAFACAHVIVLVTSQAPLAMDPLLAEFHRACIYTVPKHVMKSESGLNEEDYLKVLGYREEEDGKIESTEQYLGRLESYMKLYGALIQTEIEGVNNLHGIEHGWAWLARLLNHLPANIYTAVAVEAFLKMAGYKLFRKYKSEFRKLLNIISKQFVSSLETRKDPKLNPVVLKIKTYINKNQYLKEPEGLEMQTSKLSDEVGRGEQEYGSHQNQYSSYNQLNDSRYYQNQYYRQY